MRSGLAALAFAASLAGYAIPVTDTEIDWRFPVLSKQGCPDLTGRYLVGEPLPVASGCSYSGCGGNQPIGLFALITGGGKNVVVPGTTFEWFNEFPKQTVEHRDKSIRVTVIDQTARDVVVTVLSETGVAYVKGSVPLGHANIGCHAGVMIIREVRNLAKAESAYGLVRFSETEIRQAGDGNLHVRRWLAERLRSNLTGKAIGPVRDAREDRWTFQFVGKQ